MKKIITTIILLCAMTTCFAQSSDLESTTPRADKLFKRMWYKESAELYEREFDKLAKLKSNKDSSEYITLLKKAGDSYYFNTDMENAYRWYDKLVSDHYSQVEPEYVFRYAHSLEGIGKYKESKQWMKEFAKRTKNSDDRSSKFNQEEQTIEDVIAIEPHFTLHNLSINTEYSDFGPAYYKDKLIYSSAIDSSNYHTRLYEWNEQPFLNMYIGDMNEIESDVEKVDDFSDKLNTRYHEATLAFSPDETKVYFTRNNYDGKLHRDGEGTNHLKLYSADLIRSEKENDTTKVWRNVKELPFNSEDYSVGHPTVSSDGKLLYFVSDMPGSIGATDIFVVDILEDNNSNDENFTGYSSPRNLGSTVNTAGREMFPYITDSSLYFASDGHLGLGGLDVFESTINDTTFNYPVNLGAPLNSELDDFAFIVKEEENKGFVSSNRVTGKGDDDIYSFVRSPLEPAKAPIAKVCEQAIRGFVSNTITGERISNVSMTLFDESGKSLATTTTDLAGAYNFNKVLPCGTKYKVTAAKTGYKPKEKPVLTLATNGETVVALGLDTLHELIVEEKGLLKIKIGIIYFDLDKSFIRNDASIELNKIVVLMRQYTKMHIKIESHTDSRNTDEYNRSLSDRRAKSTREYLISQGIESSRLESAIGYGESQLINKCRNGVSCTEVEHQMNRRSEFIITKM